MTTSSVQTSDAARAQFVLRSTKIFRHASIFVAGNVFLVVAGLMFKIYVARTIGAGALGVFGLGMTVANFFALVATLGLPMLVARFIPTYLARGEPGRVRALLSRGILLLAAMVAGGAVVMWSLSSWISLQLYRNTELAVYLPLFVLIFAMTTFSGFLGAALRGFQEVARLTAITTFFRFLVKAGVTCSLFLAGWKLQGFIYGEIVALTLVVCLLAWSVRSLTPGKGTSAGQSEQVFDRETLGFVGSIAGLNWLNFLRQNADKILLGIFLGATEIGIYVLALGIAAYLSTCLKAVNSILGPTIAELHAGGDSGMLDRIFMVSTKWMLGLTWPLGMVLVFFSSQILGIFGDEFRAGALALSLVAIGELVNVAAGSVGNLLVMSGNQRMEVIARCLNIAVALPLYLILIPEFGIGGAALAFAVGNVLMNVTRVWLVSRRLQLVAYSFDSLRILPALGATSIVLWTLRGPISAFSDLQVLVLSVLAAYTTFAGVVALGGLSGDDRVILSSLLRSLRQFGSQGSTPSQA